MKDKNTVLLSPSKFLLNYIFMLSPTSEENLFLEIFLLIFKIQTSVLNSW